MATRTDIHRPSAPEFDPQSYELADVFDLQDEWNTGDRTGAIAGLAARGYRFAGSTSGGCGHCGTHIRYAALMLHSNGHDMMYVGETCLTTRFQDITKAQFAALRKGVHTSRVQGQRQEAITALVDQHPLLAELTYRQTAEWAGGFLRDVADQLRRTGTLSRRQIGTAEEALRREISHRDTKVAAAAVALPVPTFSERITIEGTVLTTKWQDSDYGDGALKMLVQHKDGWKIWGTVPRSISPNNGDQVQFVARVTPSRDDVTFGFFSRPAKARILEGVS